MRASKRLIVTVGIAAVLLIGGIVTVIRLLDSGEDEAWEHIQNTGVLRVGMDAAYPPFEYLGENNQIIGFDVDVAQELGRRLGVEMEFVNIAYDGLFDALLTRRVDILISGLVSAPEFEGKANFSVPYFNVGEHLVVRDESGIQTIEDLADHHLAVEIGSGGDVEGRKWQRRLSALEITRYPDANAAIAAVVNGEADAALVDGVTARLAVGQHPELRVAENVVDTLIAAAVSHDSPTLKVRVDEVMQEMIDDGTISTLVEQWFGPQD